MPYQPADGVALSSGSVDARNLLIVTKAKGEAGVLSGSLINLGTQDLKVTFATDSGDGTGKTAGTVDLGPREQTQITGVEVASVAAEPGALTGLIMSTDAGDAVTQVPVLAPNEYYSTLTADPRPRRPTPTAPRPARPPPAPPRPAPRPARPRPPPADPPGTRTGGPQYGVAQTASNL